MSISVMPKAIRLLGALTPSSLLSLVLRLSAKVGPGSCHRLLHALIPGRGRRHGRGACRNVCSCPSDACSARQAAAWFGEIIMHWMGGAKDLSWIAGSSQIVDTNRLSPA